MKKSLYILFSLILLISACKNNESDGPVRTVLTFTMNPGIMVSGKDYWVIVRDNDTGELLDLQQITVENTPVVFETNKSIPSGKMDVTILDATSNSTTGPVFATTYTDIDVGATWTWPRGFPQIVRPSGNVVGSYTLKITGVPSFLSVNVSDEFGYVTDNPYADYTFSGGTVTVKANINANGTSQLVSLDIGTKPKYVMINNPVAGNTLTIDYGDFKEFDRYITLTLPEATSGIYTEIVGYKDGSPANWDSFQLQRYDAALYSDHNNIPKKKEISIGVLNTFKKYTMDIFVSGLYYYIYGPAPASLEYVDPSGYSAKGKTIDDYQVTGSQNFNYRDVVFANQDINRSTTFIYRSPQGSKSKLHEAVTPEIASKYGVDFSKVQYNNTTFVIKGATYSDLLKFLFDPAFDESVPYIEIRG